MNKINNLISNLNNNSIRIGVVSTDLTSNALRITNLETSNVAIWSNHRSNVIRIDNLVSGLNDNSTRIEVVSTDLTSNALRITNLETSNVAIWSNHRSNVTRIDNLVSNLNNNSTRIGVVSTDLTSNAGRITNLETSNVAIWSNHIANVTRIANLETNLNANSTRIGAVTNDLISNALRITNLEDSAVAISPTSFNTGDIVYASANDTWTTLPLSANDGYVLTADITTGLPKWKAQTGDVSNYTTDGAFTGISNIAPFSTLNIGSNVVIDDTGADVLYVNGNVYNTGSILSSTSVTCPELYTTKIFIRNTEIVAERPPRIIRLI